MSYLICVIILTLICIIIKKYNIVSTFISNKALITDKPDTYRPNVYYINLIHRKDRKIHIETQLNKINYPKNKIFRIDAIKHKNGATGCSLSHIKALKEAKKSNNNYSIILEDDFEWVNSNIVNEYLNKINNLKYEWNVILLSCNGGIILNKIKENNCFNSINNCGTASGYIIKHSYIDTLLDLWIINVNHRIKNNINPEHPEHHQTACDVSWKQLQDKSWLITDPKLGKQIKSYSDIQKRIVDYKV